MKKFTVYLSREYVVQIEARNEDEAKENTELYVSGGVDDSDESIRNQNNFNILKIIPTLNDTFCIED